MRTCDRGFRRCIFMNVKKHCMRTQTVCRSRNVPQNKPWVVTYLGYVKLSWCTMTIPFYILFKVYFDIMVTLSPTYGLVLSKPWFFFKRILLAFSWIGVFKKFKLKYFYLCLIQQRNIRVMYKYLLCWEGICKISTKERMTFNVSLCNRKKWSL